MATRQFKIAYVSHIRFLLNSTTLVGHVVVQGLLNNSHETNLTSRLFWYDPHVKNYFHS